ncbi:glycosyltransferase family 2 protein [Arthrobacter sp. ISL-30]|uniref:glycosyltransferase family 2 protein n=1 Tax=Arthrobacter sp. ISL-30 TaxID=2819109 RepID=UPI001BE5A186|nr:glycosyltransferase family 2 protein [Arthrobacter sp. ISL-30]MBT2514359.1 glycosyltransferase family 2 protein [Arthrobacter sp. ISL-30]
MDNLPSFVLSVLGPALFAGVTFIGVRMASYWWSFAFHWGRYRRSEPISTLQLTALDVPFTKIQITTSGSSGSTEVILRGVGHIMDLAKDAPVFYASFLSVEVVTESAEQRWVLERAFHDSPLPLDVLVVPHDYLPRNGTRLKARGLHYAVEQRRKSWNSKPGRTFIVHYDEESVMVPAELRKLIACLATTDKKVLEGPIYYPLDYMRSSSLCRAMEANRPIVCYECRHVMETGNPFHLHGSNLVIDEELENEIGWDIGCLNGQPFIAEDYVFGMKAFSAYGKNVFGWHGCLMLEQPPFSVRSAFRQRYRWVFGVLQGMAAMGTNPNFAALPWKTRAGLIWGTRYRISTFALGSLVGVLCMAVMPTFLIQSVQAMFLEQSALAAGPEGAWLSAVGIMWIGSVFVGVWHNVADSELDPMQRSAEIARAVLLAPIAGLVESSAALHAVIDWARGKRKVQWVPTPKTKEADVVSTRRSNSYGRFPRS